MSRQNDFNEEADNRLSRIFKGEPGDRLHKTGKDSVQPRTNPNVTSEWLEVPTMRVIRGIVNLVLLLLFGFGIYKFMQWAWFRGTLMFIYAGITSIALIILIIGIFSRLRQRDDSPVTHWLSEWFSHFS
jgi:hypothetical protein